MSSKPKKSTEKIEMKTENAIKPVKKVGRPYNKWKPEQETALIQEYAKHVQDFNDLGKKQSPLWASVTEKLRSVGVTVSSASIQQKFINLRNNFKKQYHDRTKSEEDKQKVYPHYQILYELYEKVVESKLKIRKQELEKQISQADLNETLESEKTQYIVELLDGSTASLLSPGEPGAENALVRYGYFNISGHQSEDQEIAEHKVSDEMVPAQKIPDKEILAQKVPEQKIPAQKAPAQKTYTQKMPEQKAAAQKPTNQNVPAQKILNQRASGQNLPDQQILSQKVPYQQAKEQQVSTELLYIERNTMRIDKNTPLNRNTRYYTAPGNQLKRRALEPINSKSQSQLKVPKLEMVSIKQEVQSLRTSVKELNKVQIQKRGFTQLPVSPDLMRAEQNQEMFDLTGLADENGMVTIIAQVEEPDVSEIKMQDPISYKGNHFEEIMKNQPQSTKNHLTVSSPDNTLSPVISMKDVQLLDKPKNYTIKKISKNSTFPSPPHVITLQDASRGISHAPQSTKNNISEVTIQKIPKKVPDNKDKDKIPDEPPTWFSSFMMKFQSLIHRQNSVEEKLEDIYTKLTKIEKQLQK